MQITIHNPNNLPVIDFWSVKPFQDDLKVLKEENHAKLRGVLLNRGFEIPLFLWNDPEDNEFYLLDGHQRVKVMIAEDMNDNGSRLVPYIQLQAKDKKEAKAKLLEITSQYGTITREGLDEYLKLAELPKMETLEFVHFDAIRLSKDDMPDVEEDDAPDRDETKEPLSKYGEVYNLGRHKLMCGNAIVGDDVTILMGDIMADMIFSDPPYNVAYEGKTKDKLTIQNDSMTDDKFYEFLYFSFLNMARVSKKGAAAYICHADSEGLNFRKAFMEAGFLLKQSIIWNKNVFVMGRQDYQWKHEPILYGWQEGASHSWYGPRNDSTVWDIDRPARSESHPTMKPVQLVAKAINNSSKDGDVILDLFGGSGSTMAACEQLNRACYMMELDPKYCDVIRKRYWKLANNGDETGWEDGTSKLEKD